MKRILMLAAAWLCGAPALGWTLEGGDLGGWKTRELTIHVNPTGCNVDTDTLYALLDQAINSWNGVPSANISLRRDPTPSATTPTEFLAGTATDAPVIICDTNFGTNNGVDPDFVPAATRVSGNSTNINYGGIELNAVAGSGAEISTLTREQLLITVAHELGHVLGLGHSSMHEALMYYSINNKVQATLTRDDQDGLTYLYPRNEFTAGSFGCAAIHTGTAHPTFEWLVPFVILQLLAGRWLMKRIRPEPLL